MSKSSGLTWSEHAARQMQARIHGSHIPSVEECVLSTFTDGEVHTRSEVVHDVWLLTGIAEHEVEKHISGVLRKLEEAGKLVHGGHNDWRAVKES